MAEVFHLHRHPQPSRTPVSASIGSHQEEPLRDEEEYHNQSSPFIFDFDSLSPPKNSSNPSFFDYYATSFDFGLDLNSETENLGCEHEDPDCFFFGGKEDDEQIDFVTDLFEPRQSYVAEDLIWELDSGRAEDLDMEFGFGPGIRSDVGLRIVNMDSESDFGEFDANSGFVNNDDDNYRVSNNSFRTSENEREEFEWEEVNERIRYDERENLNLVINLIDEISVASDVSSSDGENSGLGDDEGAEADRNLEWEVLLAVNNLERSLDFENPEENSENGSIIPRISIPEDYILTMEYDALFGQLVENQNASKGTLPAAKSVVENLPSVVLTKEDVAENNSEVICAVCKDELATGEKATRMPCCHLYHGECIFPWLSIRNTCPVCRYELPTDDADYEKRSGRVGSGSTGSLVDDFEFRYNF